MRPNEARIDSIAAGAHWINNGTLSVSNGCERNGTHEMHGKARKGEVRSAFVHLMHS